MIFNNNTFIINILKYVLKYVLKDIFNFVLDNIYLIYNDIH